MLDLKILERDLATLRELIVQGKELQAVALAGLLEAKVQAHRRLQEAERSAEIKGLQKGSLGKLPF